MERSSDKPFRLGVTVEEASESDEPKLETINDDSAPIDEKHITATVSYTDVQSKASETPK